MKSVIGMCAKNEHKYIQECICFNYLQGWDKIIVCLHDVPDEPEPDLTKEMIYKLPDEVLKKVELLNVEEEPGWGFQHKAYHLMLQRVMDYDWLALFDVDEYLYDSQKRPINDLLATVSNDVGQILIPWVEFGHNNRILSATPQETRLAVFTKSSGIDPRALYKAIVRPRNVIQNLNDHRPSVYWYHCHHMITKGRHVDFLNRDLVPVNFDFDSENMFIRFHSIARQDFTVFDPCIAHYYTGSMEDWVIRTKRTARTSAVTLPRTFQTFFDLKYNKEDLRMSIYVDELRELLSKCKQ